MCGEIYIFDQGTNVYPRFVCAKVPKRLANCSSQETARRFIYELRLQLKFYHNFFVHWPFDFREVLGVPVALFRYWGNDLGKLIKHSKVSEIEKLSIMVYACEGLKHCYRNGLVAHQDLKPSNIFLRDLTKDFIGLPSLDIYNAPLIADFGLSNASINQGIFDGERPYMAPEQWNRTVLSPSTDIFALGVILYELMTDGFHPVGIKLHDFWPQPQNGNSKKWTRGDAWRRWVDRGCIIDGSQIQVDPKLLHLVKRMVSTDPKCRPSIADVTNSLLCLMETRSKASYEQVTFLTDYFERQVSNKPLEQQWPHLFRVWNRFEEKFG